MISAMAEDWKSNCKMCVIPKYWLNMIFESVVRCVVDAKQLILTQIIFHVWNWWWGWFLASSSGPPRGNKGWRFTAGLKCKHVMVYHHYLWIFVFVWDRAVCGTRKHQFASVDCSGIMKKIHTRKIRRRHGFVHDEDFLIFHGLGTCDEAK